MATRVERAVVSSLVCPSSSPNGDRWYLIRDASGKVFVRHEANLASGGSAAQIEVGAFLNSGRGLEQQELLRLIGTLLDDEAAHV